MKILHVAPAYYPATAWGGPTESVYRLCNAIATIPGVKLRVLTTDTSGTRGIDRLSPEENSGNYPGYEVTFCRKLAGADFTPAVWLHIWNEVRWANVIHLTSVYSSTTFPTLVAARMLRKPLVWSPRGSLQRWARSRRRIAKYFWERVCDLLLARERSVLHTTSKAEAEESAAKIRNAKVAVIPNGVDTVPQATRTWIPDGRLRLLYLGRLDPKKGIENLLDALTLVRGGSFFLQICGEGETGYVASLKKRSDRLGLSAKVHFAGHVAGEAKRRAFVDADVCVVPSFMENFCLVVAEALAHGTPVIASHGTPWSEIEDHAAGVWIANDPQTIAKAIDDFRSRDLAGMGNAGREWMEGAFGWQFLAKRMIQVYQSLCDGERSATTVPVGR